jgi:Tetratricopeptide repeat
MTRPFSLPIRARVFAIAGCVVLLLAGSAWAQAPAAPASAAPAPANDAAPTATAPGAEQPAAETAKDPNLQRAREAFRLGSTLARQGQWQEALAAYERSAELRPHSVTTYNIGYVERALGHLTRSRRLLALALEPGAGSGLEPLPENLQSTARAYLTELDRKIVRVAVTLADPQIAVSVDGRPLDVLSAGERPLLGAGTAAPGRPAIPPAAAFDLLIDPGRHVILLFSPGKGETLVDRSFAPGSSPTLRLAIEPQAARAGSPRPAPAALVADQPADSRVNLRPWMWTAFAVGAAGVAVGSVFGILAIDKDAELADACQPKSNCPLDKSDDQAQLDDYAMGANIGFGIGIVGLGVGTALWFIDGRTREKPAPASRPAMRIGLSRGGFVVNGRF